MQLRVSSIFLLILFCCFGAGQASSLRVDVQGGRVDLQADAASLSSVLEAISTKTGLIVKSANPLSDIVSFQISEITLEECLQRLMVGRNYVIVYKEEKDQRYVLSELWVDISESIESNNVSPPLGDQHLRRHEKNWFDREVKAETTLMKQIYAAPIKGGDESTEKKGIQITKIAKDSFFQKVGIEEGDIIQDVNGHPVTTIPEFIETLQSASSQGMIVRIDRQKSDKIAEPIYIKLH
jgi:hypothetical protein